MGVWKRYGVCTARKEWEAFIVRKRATSRLGQQLGLLPQLDQKKKNAPARIAKRCLARAVLLMVPILCSMAVRVVPMEGPVLGELSTRVGVCGDIKAGTCTCP